MPAHALTRARNCYATAAQGDALFQTHENLEHLAMMEVVLGPLPPSVIARSECALLLRCICAFASVCFC
jgi:hypothetical protein